MSHDSRSMVESIRSGQRRATGGDAPRRLWRVQYQGGEELIEADDVEITASGALAFYRCASRTERDRTLVTAFSPELAWRCQLEGER
jgi:hypothetical protein